MLRGEIRCAICDSVNDLPGF
ncbi:MAG: hypothetical protein EBR73_01110 [Rhodobacteraceae bacterium]|nr:hypothetical protein [Paracoccaceae bacterium]